MNKVFCKLYYLLINDVKPIADAVVWLQGDRLDRAGNVLEIYQSKLAPVVVLSGNNELVGTTVRPGENNIDLITMKEYLIKAGVNELNIIVDDSSLNTRDQARHIIDLCQEKGWKKVIVVASAYHQPRVWLTFLKQRELISSQCEFYNFPFKMEMTEIPGGRQESVELLCNLEIKKIDQYTNDLCSFEQGIDYLLKRRTL